MITNTDITLYHKWFDEEARLEKWIRHYYEKVWWFGGKGTNTQIGYENANDVQIRIPYESNENLNIADFSIGDIVCKGNIEKTITSQSELNGVEFYNITAINNNTFGNNQHIHLGGK